MREILFRGKQVDNGEWVNGSLLNPYRKKPLIAHYENEQEILGYTVEVISDTVGQYTGLKDRKSTWIFEGDILIYVVDGEYDVNEKYLVVFDDDEAAFRTKFYCKGKYMCYEDIIPCENFEIIGNIHDNPELLKGDD